MRSTTPEPLGVMASCVNSRKIAVVIGSTASTSSNVS
jgi:hypothetical protein